jgi:hypothetical protein
LVGGELPFAFLLEEFGDRDALLALVLRDELVARRVTARVDRTGRGLLAA